MKRSHIVYQFKTQLYVFPLNQVTHRLLQEVLGGICHRTEKRRHRYRHLYIHCRKYIVTRSLQIVFHLVSNNYCRSKLYTYAVTVIIFVHCCEKYFVPNLISLYYSLSSSLIILFQPDPAQFSFNFRHCFTFTYMYLLSQLLFSPICFVLKILPKRSSILHDVNTIIIMHVQP